jgi:hypothetical protein
MIAFDSNTGAVGNLCQTLEFYSKTLCLSKQNACVWSYNMSERCKTFYNRCRDCMPSDPKPKRKVLTPRISASKNTRAWQFPEGQSKCLTSFYLLICCYPEARRIFRTLALGTEPMGWDWFTCQVTQKSSSKWVVLVYLYSYLTIAFSCDLHCTAGKVLARWTRAHHTQQNAKTFLQDQRQRSSVNRDNWKACRTRSNQKWTSLIGNVHT